MTHDANRTNSGPEVIEKPEGCCCQHGDAMCFDCMQGDHRTCCSKKQLARYRSPEDHLRHLEPGSQETCVCNGQPPHPVHDQGIGPQCKCGHSRGMHTRRSCDLCDCPGFRGSS